MENIGMSLVALIVGGSLVLLHLTLGWNWLLRSTRYFIRVLVAKNKTDVVPIHFREILALVILPILGYLTVRIFNDGSLAPTFNIEYSLAFLIPQALSVVCYFLSRMYKHTCGPLLVVIMPAMLLVGIICNVLLLIHMCMFFLLCITLGWLIIFPALMVFTYYSIIQSGAYMIAEIYNLLEIARTDKLLAEEYPIWLQKIISIYYGENNVLAQLIIAPLLICAGNYFIHLIYREDVNEFMSFICTSADELVSTQGGGVFDSGGGSDYLVTIAAHGNPKMVKPLFVGKRHGRKIKVTRQLQVCNAFEQIMEEHIPRIHKPLRKFYDWLQIPIHKWKHNRLLANCLFLFFVPLQKVFFLTLILVDKNPFTRINKQYR